MAARDQNVNSSQTFWELPAIERDASLDQVHRQAIDFNWHSAAAPSLAEPAGFVPAICGGIGRGFLACWRCLLFES